MPLRSDWTGERCPIARSLEVLGDPWVMLVLRQAFSGVRRFEQLRDQLGVAENVLSKRLSTMVDADCCDACRTRTGDVPGTSTS
jgi:DNA-binding HxlR family transcriptional regulator